MLGLVFLLNDEEAFIQQLLEYWAFVDWEYDAEMAFTVSRRQRLQDAVDVRMR